MNALQAFFEQEYILRALLAALMTGILCGTLGCFILLRNMSLVGDALSHAILPGVVAGFLIAGHSVVAFFVGSVAAGLMSAVFITWLQRNVKTRADAAIGIVFSAMFALGVIGISYITRQEGVHLDMKDFLFGNILGVSPLDLWLMGGVTLFVICCITLLFRFFFITTFSPIISTTLGIPSGLMHYFLMLMLSFAVVACLQAVGVILAVAMLIIPASTAYLLSKQLKKMVLLSASFGTLSALSGFLLSVVFETTPGPAMTLTAALLFFIVVLFAPEKGFIPAFFHNIRFKRETRAEDLLKEWVKQSEVQEISLDQLKDFGNGNKYQVSVAIDEMKRNGWIRFENQLPLLTEEGRSKAYQLIRAHRLWESYLAEKEKMNPEQIHDHAERIEHHLSEGILKSIEIELGFPKFDPHGSPIPQTPGAGMCWLSQLHPNEKGLITTEQPDEHVSAEMWKRGITPNTPIEVLSVDEHRYLLRLASSEIEVPVSLCERVWIIRV
jgi:ABC-type Mn2+/Zn2+ transport system permease subunit/Mn-dependent DtxR family transcriptional regulator